MSTKQGKAVPMDHEVPDGTAVISIVNLEGNPKGVTVEETVIKDNTTAPRPSIGENVGEALEQALQKNSNKPKSSTSNKKKEKQKMEAKTSKTNTTTATTETKSQPKAEQKPQTSDATASKAEQKPQQTKEAAAPAEQSAPAPAEKKEELANLVSELRSLKNELSSTPIRVEHYKSTENTGREAGHQFLVGLAAGAGVAIGVTAITTVAWLIQRKIAGSGDSAE